MVSVGSKSFAWTFCTTSFDLPLMDQAETTSTMQGAALTVA